ncbi:hypothetical protein CFI00_07935 [Nocardioides sp. S5]|uniref:hypothetical protein n=1 Tax=Nocardioides sp. S5 TaxID=2017486 RepID=UPI001A8CAF20|nr:hypothetical protein [Nocardioides sp. S5]QSR30435.1 hypothetical protein CFI00_07935 [Nocardioides sp. S5]
MSFISRSLTAASAAALALAVVPAGPVAASAPPSSTTLTLSTTESAAVARLGRLRAGGYRVEVTYVGDSQHRRTRVTGRFRVPRG